MGADLTDADLSLALLGGADLTGAVMRGTRLTGADLDATILRQLVAADGILGLDQARNLDRALRDPP